MTTYLIIGNGVAGATAAEEIAHRDPQGAITIVSDEPEPFYYRVRLPELMAGEVEIGQITRRSASWYAEKGMDLRLGLRITSIDADSRLAFGEGGESFSYDELLLATGAHSFVPPLPGADLPGVYTLRTAGDARAIAQAARQSDKAILMGGGLLGLEAGHALTRLGLKVEAVEMFDRLLPRQMDYQGAAKLQKLLESRGFVFHLGVKASEIFGQNNAQGAQLEDGTRLQSGLILFSAGVRGNIELAQNLGLEINNGVVVDDSMQTSREHIWAAGDHIEHRGRLYGIWPASQAQGKVAGANMAGGQETYAGTVMSNSLKVVGVDLTSAGDIDVEGKLQAVVYEDQQAYRKIVVDHGRIKGFIFFGLSQGVAEATKAMDQGRDVSAHLAAMEQKDFSFSELLA